VRAAPPELELTEISFKDLPLYSYDYDAKYECTPCCHAMLERSRSV